ncbi:hypothetical protein Sjap_009140 [Stephania japonica]|uniref:Uncharacterized protein n=1 Tax=Stephania japonica TaxID=461633 RepID=A0AAP0JQU9_9MAGN
MDEDEVERRRQQEKGKDKVQWIDMYAKCGSLDDMSLFKMVVWNLYSLLGAFVRKHQLNGGLLVV